MMNNSMTKFQSILISLTILMGAGVTLWGLSQMYFTTSSPHKLSSIYRNFGFSVLGMAVLEIFARYFKIRRLISGAIIACLIVIITGVIWPLLVSLWLALASFILGHAILSVFRIDKDNVSGSTALLIGAGIYGTAVGLLAHFPVNYPGLYGIALVIPVILGWRSINHVVTSFRKNITQSDDFRWLDLTIALVALVHFSVALMPEVGADALAMHLFIPSHLAHHHQWGFDVTTYVWAVEPMMGDWIFSIGYMFAGETTARMINVGFIFILSWLIRDLVIWAGGNAQGARWAVLLFLVSPFTFAISSSLFIESVWAAFIVAGSISILKVLSTKHDQKQYLPQAGILLGCALAAKAVTFTILPALLLLLLFRYRVWGKAQFASIILLSLVLFLIIGGIPYITAWFITGNPVFPFFNEHFQAPQYPAINFSAPAIYEKGITWDTIYRMTFGPGRYSEGTRGSSGFQWLLLLLPVIVLFITRWHRKGLALVIVGILAVVFTFQQTAYLRYVFPSFVILSAAIGLALSLLISSNNVLLSRLVLITAITTICLNLIFFKSGTWYGGFALQPLISEAGRTQYLQRRLPIRNAINLVNQLNVWKSPVMVYGPPLTAGLFSDALYSSWYNHKFQTLIQNANSAQDIIKILLNEGVDYVILDKRWRSPEKRLIINEATEEVANLGYISVRELSLKNRFNTELLKDTFFTVNNYWYIPPGVKKTVDGVIVSKDAPATQVVSVTSGRRYLLSVKSSCLTKPSSARLQVNWLNAMSNLISSNIQVFNCTKIPESKSMQVVAPNGAIKAVIYATGHTQEPLIINNVSFKK